MDNLKWLIIIALGVVGCTLWISKDAVQKAYVYLKLDGQTEIIDPQWSIVAVNDERYHPLASYHFKANNRLYDGKTLLSHPFYRNPWSAEKGIQEVIKETHKVWFSSNNPEINALERNFPIKETIYTIILWGLLAYFTTLIAFATKRHSLQR